MWKVWAKEVCLVYQCFVRMSCELTQHWKNKYVIALPTVLFPLTFSLVSSAFPCAVDNTALFWQLVSSDVSVCISSTLMEICHPSPLLFFNLPLLIELLTSAGCFDGNKKCSSLQSCQVQTKQMSVFKLKNEISLVPRCGCLLDLYSPWRIYSTNLLSLLLILV